MSDLGEILASAGTELGSQTDPMDDTALRRVVAGARRRRVRRHAYQGVAAVAAVAILGAGGWWGAQRQEPVPAHTPTPAVTSPSPTSAPSPSATAALDEIPGLPPTRALPPGLLDATTPGWVLTVYRSERPAADGQDPDVVVHTVVLVSPEGERYRVVDLPLDTAVSLLRWDAGSSEAVVRIEWVGQPAAESVPRAELDLVTGALTPTPVDLGEYGGGPYYEGLTADGAELWSTATSTDAATSDVYRRTDDGALSLVGGVGTHRPLLDPTRTRIAASIWQDDAAFTVIDVEDGHRTELDYGVPGKQCDVVTWLDADALLVRCAVERVVDDHLVTEDVTLHRLDITGASTRVIELRSFADDEPIPSHWEGAGLGGGRGVVRVFLQADDGCTASAAVWDGASLVPLPGVPPGHVEVAAVGGIAYVVSTGTCHEAAPARLTAYDVGAGTSWVVAPEPAATGDVPWVAGLRTWVVAGVSEAAP